MRTRSDLTKTLVPKFIFDDVPLCSEVDPELFFPQESEIAGTVYSHYVNAAAAKEVCDACPLKLKCLEYAMSTNEIGIWGGTTELQRHNLKKSMRRKAARRRPESSFS